MDCDVSEEEVINLFEYIKDTFGKLDVVINNAAATESI